MTKSTVTSDTSAGANGFFAEMSPVAARKQLRVSLAVAAVLSIATAVAALSGGLSRPHERQAAVKLTIEQPGKIQVRQAGIAPAAISAPLRRGI
ncbi:MAG: hypothetical protein AB7F96_18705 [Beijerinckiaceae bacterium]